MLGRLAPHFKQAINRFWLRKGSVGILTRLLGDRNYRHDVGGTGGGGADSPPIFCLPKKSFSFLVDELLRGT